MMVPASPGPSAEPLEWHFSQVFGERTPGEEVQEGARSKPGRQGRGKWRSSAEMGAGDSGGWRAGGARARRRLGGKWA